MARKRLRKKPSPPTESPKDTRSLTIRLANFTLLQLGFNLMAALLMCLAALLLDNLGMRFGLYILIPLIGVQFLLFPLLMMGLLGKLGLAETGSGVGDFWYFMILGFGLIIWLFPSTPMALDAWRLTRSTEASATAVDQVLRHADDPVVLDLPGFHMLSEPRGQYVRRSRSKDGKVSTTYYAVVPLVPSEGAADPRLWLGWKGSLPDTDQTGYFRVNPWNNNEYWLAAENALGKEPPDEVMILERTPGLARARADAWDGLRLSFLVANAATLGALVVIYIAIGIHRLRRR